MVDKGYNFTGEENPGNAEIKRWIQNETDLTHDSPFHTLGRGATNAAPGNHKHPATDITDLPDGIDLSDSTPKLESGSGSPGVGNKAAREDHVHPASAGGVELGNTVPPVDNSTGGAGTSAFAARADHHHPIHNAPHATTADSATNAGNADTVDGKHASDFAATEHNHDSAYPTKAGVGASGTWAIDITGNAGRVDGYSVWVGTQAEYNQVIPQSSTLYFIKG